MKEVGKARLPFTYEVTRLTEQMTKRGRIVFLLLFLGVKFNSRIFFMMGKGNKLSNKARNATTYTILK